MMAAGRLRFLPQSDRDRDAPRRPLPTRGSCGLMCLLSLILFGIWAITLLFVMFAVLVGRT